MMAMDRLQAHFHDRRPVLLIVMDGWGMGSGGPEDAIARANTPNFDRLWREYAHTRLLTHGPFVGLASPTDLGGSEVGHLTMGAGLILDQGPTRIGKAIADGSFFRTEALCTVTEHCLESGGTLHLLGLLSDGNVHSHIDHILALIAHADHLGIARLRMHALLDGRDVGIQTAQIYVARLEEAFAAINAKPGRDYRFASGGGREAVTMDRDNNWDKVQEGWELHVHGHGDRRFTSMQAAIDHFRAATPGLVDQDIPGFVIVDEDGEAVGPMQAIRAHHPGAHITCRTTAPFEALARASGCFDAMWIDARPGIWNIPGWLNLRARLRSGSPSATANSHPIDGSRPW